jgi:hypothetical protein
MAPIEPQAFEYIVIGGGSGGSGTVSFPLSPPLFFLLDGVVEWEEGKRKGRRERNGRLMGIG